MKVVGYVRVSTSIQVEGRLSIEAQKAKIIAYCNAYDLTLDEIIIDEGESAATLERPGMIKLLDMIYGGTVSDIIITRLDRLTRSMRDLHRLLEEVLPDVQLHSVMERVDTSTATGRLVLNVLMSVAEWERQAIGERTSIALQAKLKRGERTGNPPYGWAWENGKQVEDPEEQRTRSFIIKKKLEGLTIRGICRELERMGFNNRRGNPLWAASTVWKILQREQDEQRK